jgi:hypothetical protein
MFEVGKIYETREGQFTKLVSGRDSDVDLLPGAYEEITDPHYVLQPDDLLSAKGNSLGWGFVLCSDLGRTGQTRGENMWANALRRLPDTPPKEVLRWVKDTMPDKVGLWVRQAREGMWAYIVTDPRRLYPKDEYCYLGPIPEILPALKKVRKFMWLEYMDSDALHPGESVYKEHWIEEGEAPDVAGWLRTDKWTDVIV